MIFIVDDDEVMAECIARATERETEIFASAIDAMNAIINGRMPKMIFLDILLDGPDGFTLLNEMVSYEDTARIPIIVVSSLNLEGKDLSEYGVVKILQKEKMTPREIKECVEQYAE